jgi:AcrR family transcriptional regulator
MLCRDRPFAEVTVRDIAAAADMNHGFVHTWFGSKGGLALAAAAVLIDQITARVSAGEVASTGVRTPDVTILIRLLAWLQTDEASLELATARDRPVIDLVASRFATALGFDTATAVALAELTIAGAAGVILVGDSLRLNDAVLTTLWPQMVEVFAAHLHDNAAPPD